MDQLIRVALEQTLIRFGQDLNERARRDASGAEITAGLLRVVRRVHIAFDDSVPVPFESLLEQARLVDAFTTRQTNKAVKGVFQIPVPDPESAQVLYRKFAIEQADRIKSMDTDYFDRVRQMTIEAVAEGKSTAELRKQLQEQLEITRSQAQFIARDSTGTLNGLITEKRQTELGVTQYRWRTSKDIRVRGNPGGLYPKAVPSHFDREGVIFDWNDPPSDGHPGVPFNCRCTAEPVLPD